MSEQRGFFDLDERYAALSAAGDPLEKLETRKNRWRFGGGGDSLMGSDHGEPLWTPSPCSV